MSLTSASRFVVDAADSEKFDAAKNELRELLAKPPLAGIPLLVLGVRIHTRRMQWLTHATNRTRTTLRRPPTLTS